MRSHPSDTLCHSCNTSTVSSFFCSVKVLFSTSLVLSSSVHPSLIIFLCLCTLPHTPCCFRSHLPKPLNRDHDLKMNDSFQPPTVFKVSLPSLMCLLKVVSGSVPEAFMFCVQNVIIYLPTRKYTTHKKNLCVWKAIHANFCIENAIGSGLVD